MARCGCAGGECACSVTGGEGVTVTGSGSIGDPFVVNAEASCDTVRTCLSGTDGIEYTPGSGVIRANIQTGCGLTGNGRAATPLTAAVSAWSFPCDLEDNAGRVYCDADGLLRSEPRGMVDFHSFQEVRNYADLLVPAGFDQPGDSFQTDVTNPDPCRPAFLLVEREADVDFILPPGAGAAYGHGTDEMYFLRNTGTTTINDAHTQTTKVFALAALLAPGASVPVTFDVTLGRGSGGATYNRIQVFIRAMILSL